MNAQDVEPGNPPVAADVLTILPVPIAGIASVTNPAPAAPASTPRCAPAPARRAGGGAVAGADARDAAFAGLERGAIAMRIRDAAGAAVGRYVERVAPRLGSSAVVGAVRTIGASKVAISAGSFADFEAIRATQDVEDTIVPRRPGRFKGRLNLLDGRLGRLEAEAVDRGALNGLRDEILTRSEARLGVLQGRLDDLEARRPDRAELEALEGGLSQSFDARLAERMADLDARLGRIRAELDGAIEQSRRDIAARLEEKADAAAMGGLERTVVDLRSPNAALSERLERIRTRFDILRPGP